MPDFQRRAGLLAVLAAMAISGCASGPFSRGPEPGSPLRLAERAAAAGDHQTSATLYRQAFEADPRSIDALVGLGRSYAGLGQFARAEQALLGARARRPRDPRILLELARVQIGAGKPQAALENLDAARARAPRDLEIVTARGVALDRLSRHAEAQAAYREGLAFDPTNFALLSNLGLSYGLGGAPERGIGVLRELVRDAEANAQTRGNLALVYGLAGREREAAATLGGDLAAAQIEQNLAYYRELRTLLRQGRPIGGLQ
jgi:Flp pilus assembly protein TadD